MTRLRRAATKDVALIVVALVLVVGAVYLYTRLSKQGEASATEFVTFYCEDCKEWLKISHREFERRWDRKEFKSIPGGPFYVKCGKCGKLSAKRADDPESVPQVTEESN